MSLHIDESPVDTLSDIKMEISDTTNSLESLGLSPTALGGHDDDDHNDPSIVIKRLIEVESHSLRPLTTLTTLTTMTSASPSSPLHPLNSHQNNHNEMPLDDHAPVANGLVPDGGEATSEQRRQSNGEHNDSRLLDNRLAGANAQLAQRPKVLPFEELGSQRHNNIQRTLTSSHPLMSPNGTDSDSECSSRTDAVMAKLHHHQQQQPQATAKHQNFPDVVPHADRLQPQPNANATNSNSTAVAASRGVSVNGGPAATLRNNKLNASRLRAHSPDLLSSESEADVSQYHAAVNANFQTVALVPNAPAPGGGVAAAKCQKPAEGGGGGVAAPGTRRQRKVCGASGADDISSLDSISNHSFDDDEEHNLASLSPSSSLIDVLEDDDDDDDDADDDDDDDDDDCEGPEFVNDDIGDYDDPYPEATTPTPLHQQQPHHQKAASESCNGSVAPASPASATAPAAADASLPQYSAAEERRDSRNWQKITLPDGRTREIDMRVIEPYKRVLSHGGYLKAAGQNAIVIFCACHLPDRARADYNYVMDNLFLYVVKTLEQLVTDDYVLIYLHGGTSRRNVPPFPWLKKCYQLLDRRLRKSLKNMYLVHPTFWIKSIVWMARPFVSTKFWRKLVYVKSLDELNTHVAVEKAAIPEKVKQYDAKHN